MKTSPPELIVVLPVFNEEASIERVVREWFATLDANVGDFLLLAIDDGSWDATPGTLRRLNGEFGERMETISRPNKGHGQTCLEGYRIAGRRGIPHILQIDSDGQCDPEFFQQFWELRDRYDVIYGNRSREDGYRRVLASFMLRLMLRSAFGVACIDPNVPYRLMGTAACSPHFDRIPYDFSLANVALSALLAKDPAIRHGEVPIRFLERTGGEPSVPFSKFAEKGVELFRQLKRLESAPSHSKGNPQP